LSFAIKEFREMKMKPYLERALSLRVGQSSQLVFDNNGVAVISYYDVTSGDLKVAG